LFTCLIGTSAAFALPIGGIIHVKPQVSARMDSKEKAAWKVVGERYTLSYGEYLRTDKGGKADVLFNNGTDIVLRSNTQIQIIAPATATQPLVVRVIGTLSEIFVRAKGKTEIRSAACNAAVRGTEFLFSLPTDHSAALTVLEGAVAFYNNKGNVLVTANQQSTARADEAPTPPTAVDVTGLINWTADVTGLPVEFESRMTKLSPIEVAKQRALSEVAVKANPTDVDAHHQLARLCFDAGDYADAVRELREVTRLAPNEADGFVDLGIACGTSGDHQQAIAAFQRVEQLDPHGTIARFGQVVGWIACGDYAKARKLLATAPESARFDAVRGLLELRQGHPELALQRLSAATAKDETLYQAQALLALTQLTLNQGSRGGSRRAQSRRAATALRAGAGHAGDGALLREQNRGSHSGRRSRRAAQPVFTVCLVHPGPRNAGAIPS